MKNVSHQVNNFTHSMCKIRYSWICAFWIMIVLNKKMKIYNNYAFIQLYISLYFYNVS